MTLDEAIKHAEEVMMENLEKTKDRNASDPIAINCFECADEHRQLAEWLKELKQLREQTRWIPVSEGLPEIHNYCQLYLVTYKQGQICTAFYSETNGRSWWSIDGVEAWMPLPEPYKQEVDK